MERVFYIFGNCDDSAQDQTKGMKGMAKLEVKTRKPNVKMAGIVPDDLRVTIDGVEIEQLTGLTLNIEEGQATECAISFRPHSVSINSHVLARLHAIIKAAPDGGDDGPTN